MKKLSQLFITIVILTFLAFPDAGYSQSARQVRLSHKAESRLKKLNNMMPEWRQVGLIKVDSISLSIEPKHIQLFFSTPLSYIPVREKVILSVEDAVKKALRHKFKKYTLDIYTDHHLLKDLVPNSLRTNITIDPTRIFGNKDARIPVVSQIGKEKPVSGLY